MFGQSELTRAERETLALAVSSANSCEYCMQHHGEALRRITKDEGLVASVARDPLRADLPKMSVVSVEDNGTAFPSATSVANASEALRSSRTSDR